MDHSISNSENSHPISGNGDRLAGDQDRVRRSMAPSLSPRILPPGVAMRDTPRPASVPQYNQFLPPSHPFAPSYHPMTQLTRETQQQETVGFGDFQQPPSTTALAVFTQPQPQSVSKAPSSRRGRPSKAEKDRLQQMARDATTSSSSSYDTFTQSSVEASQPRVPSSRPSSRSSSGKAPKARVPSSRSSPSTGQRSQPRATTASRLPSINAPQYQPSLPHGRPSQPAMAIPHPSLATPSQPSLPQMQPQPQMPPHSQIAQPQTVQQIAPNLNDHRNQFIAATHYRLESSGHLLGTGIVNIAPTPAGEYSFSRLVGFVDNQAHDAARDWYNLHTATSQFSVFTPGTAISPATRQVLKVKRVAMRYEFCLSMDNEDAEPYDTKIKNTAELTLAFRMMARRNLVDVLIVFFELGEPQPVMVGESGEKVKGKRTLGGDGGEEGEGEGDAKKARIE